MERIIAAMALSLLASSAALAAAGPHPWPSSKKLHDELTFKKHVLSETFYSEGCAIGDVNQDGKMDVLAGPFWYEAPDWTPHEIRTPGQYQYDKGYSLSFVNGADDVNQDGWVDLILVGFPGQAALWYENPRGQEGHWKEHQVAAWACNESPLIVDVNGDGRLDLVTGFTPNTEDRGWMAWLSPPAKGKPHWRLHPVSQARAPGTHRFSHGLGLGDVDGDGHNDIIVTEGWWACPGSPESTEWTFHPADLGPACAHMYAYDVDGDGDNDIITSSAHDYGIWWHEQQRDAQGKPSWTRHEIHKSFSQTHALELADMNGDGLPDLVTGKRFYAHQGKDPGGKEPAVLYWFEFSRKDGQPAWTPHPIDDNSGIGTQFVVNDINGDQRLDIISSNKKGTFVFENITQR